jgi:E3 ubiquitin-protein ligase TRIP12
LEFYPLVPNEFARRDAKLWRNTDQSHPGLYVHHPNGRFHALINPDDMADDVGQCVSVFAPLSVIC